MALIVQKYGGTSVGSIEKIKKVAERVIEYYKKGDRKCISAVSKGKGIASLYDADGHFLRKVVYDKGLASLEKESN